MWLVHDMIEIEKRGKPAMFIVSGPFEKGAIASARVHGMPDIPYVVVPRIYKNLTTQQGIEQTEQAFDSLVQVLTTSPNGGRVPIPAVRGKDADACECHEPLGLCWEGAEAVDQLLS